MASLSAMQPTTAIPGDSQKSPRPPLGRRTGLSTHNVPSTKSTVLRSHFLRSHGRPPWYGEDGALIGPAFVIGIAGGSSSGKTHVAKKIVESLGSIPSVVILSQDSFYKRHGPKELALAFANQYDFDHPDALDMTLYSECLADLKACKQTNIPIYSFTEHQRLDESKYLYGATIIIAEGIMALLDPALGALYDLKVFVQCDSDLMLARRIRRDTKERGRSVDGILDQYLRFVKPAYDNYVQPTSRHADIIVPGSDNAVAIELVSTHIRQQLEQRVTHFRQRMVSRRPDGVLTPSVSRLGTLEQTSNLIVLPQTPQLKGIYTILRDKATERKDWIFFVDRLSSFLIEKALEHVPYRPRTISTAVVSGVIGKEIDAPGLCAVSILRSGGLLEKGLRRVIRDIPVGSLLVQSDTRNGEPLLLHTMLPDCVRDRSRSEHAWVLLLDAQVGTGASAFMAIRVLLDHGVRQENIIFCTLLVARSGGISVLQRAFPEVKIICGAIDDGLKEVWLDQTADIEGNVNVPRRKAWVIQPGMGQMGDRYYL